MKKILSLAVFCAAMILGFAADASAQVRVVDLNFRRIENRNGETVFTSYDVANGFRDFNFINPASPPSDTTAPVAIYDHFYRFNNHGVAAFPGSGSAADSVFLGALSLEGTSSTIDTFVVYRQISVDGISWTSADSAGYSHAIGTGTDYATDATLTYARGIGSTLDLGPAKRLTLLYFGHPNMTASGITRRAIRDVNFVRFIVTMTGGDAYNAGRNNGLRARFTYPTK